MKIHFLASAHNSLSQRLLIELSERGHAITMTLATSAEAMQTSVSAHGPDLVIAPMLKVAIPEAIWSKYTCLIVHPGIKGDRGPSSLDWAIANDEPTWGVTIIEAAGEMDAGPIWATHNFPLYGNAITKSSLYRHQVTEAAVRGVIEAVTKFESRQFQPEPLDYNRSDVHGRLRPSMRQIDRAIDWTRDGTEAIMRKINAADGSPGVRDRLWGEMFSLYGAHREDRLSGAPGHIIAQRDRAICRATVDGAVWITHLKAAAETNGAGIKLPATLALEGRVREVPYSTLPIVADIDYQTFREIRYAEKDGVGLIYFDFYNGAMSTEQCYRLRDTFLFARSRPTHVITLLGGRDFFSNGIHLNVIEAAADSALESWCNIHGINDLIHEILNTVSHLVIAGLRGNAGAGGAMLALAADQVYARDGVVLNPHYKSMGGLFGSEYWTYTLPRRVGQARAVALTEGCRPMGTREAKAIGFVDDCFGGTAAEFESALIDRARQLARSENFWRLLREKHEKRLTDERVKPLAHYRGEEIKNMEINFFGADPAYHLARERFVFKGQARPVPQREAEAPSPFGNRGKAIVGDRSFSGA